MNPTLYYAAAVVISLLAGSARQANSEILPESLARLVFILNGDFATKTETVDENGNTQVPISNNSYIPIEMSGVQNPVVLNRRFSTTRPSTLYEMSQDIHGIINIVLYTLPADDVIQSVEESPARVCENASLQLQDCTGWLQETEYGVFQGDWQHCRGPVNGEYPILKYKMTCDSVTVITDTKDVIISERQSNKRYPQVPRIQDGMKETADPCQSG